VSFERTNKVCSYTVCLVLGHAGRLERGGLHVLTANKRQ
jgi:hypothetical protein